METTINSAFLNLVKSGKRVFGNPELRLTEEIKNIEQQLTDYKNSFGKGDFFLPNKNLEADLADHKKEREFQKKCGEYLLKLVNKQSNEPFKNAFIFCDVLIDEDRYNFSIQTKFNTYLINFHNINIGEQDPISIIDNEAHSIDKLLFELSNPHENFITLDVIYNKNKILFFKNDEFLNSETKLIHISELKTFLEKDSTSLIDSNKRLSMLNFLYKNYFKKEESQFKKDINKMFF